MKAITQETIIDHRRRIRRVMLHINRNLDQKLDLDDLSDVACFSPFHFVRVFESLLGETPRQYIIRKKMEKAGFRLLGTNRSVTDVALDIAYGTPSAFCKIFKAHFGLSPRRFRDTIPADLYAGSHHPFRTVIGNRNRSLSVPAPVIRTLPEFRTVCVENQGVVDGTFLKTNLKSFEKFRRRVACHGMAGLLKNSVSIYPTRPKGPDDSLAKDFVGAVIHRETRLTQKFRHFIFPAGRYAIFTHFGSWDYAPQTWTQASLNWFPKSGQTLRDVPPLEVHLDSPAPDDPLAPKSYILIPIR